MAVKDTFWRKYGYVAMLLYFGLGLYNLAFGLLALVCMIAPVIVSVARGRYWCGNVCPRGIFYERIVGKWARGRKVPPFFRSWYFRAAVLLFMIMVMVIGLGKAWGHVEAVGAVFFRLIVLTTFVGIVLALFFTERSWCSFCPMGSLAALISYFRSRQQAKNRLSVATSCKSCQLCTKQCPMDIPVHQYKGESVSHYDCILCGKCEGTCGIGAITIGLPVQTEE